jgi:ribonuclease P protein component
LVRFALQRLKTRAQFQAVMAGPPVAKTPHFALHLSALNAGADGALLFPSAGEAWVGVLVPKRWARRAVTRNTVRRQIYEVARARTDLPCAALVVRLRSEFSRQQFVSATSDALKAAIRSELQTLFQRLNRPMPERTAHAD